MGNIPAKTPQQPLQQLNPNRPIPTMNPRQFSAARSVVSPSQALASANKTMFRHIRFGALQKRI